MRILLSSVAAAALLAACGQKVDASAEDDAAPATSAETETTTDAADEPQYTRQDVPGSVKGRQVAEVTLDEIKPAFTEKTVLKLNAIVRRSLNAATQYTKSVKSIRKSVDLAATAGATAADRKAAQDGIDKLKGLYGDAVAAQTDMDAAVAELQASDESYSKELLAGMVKYVNDVEESLSNEIDTLTAKLNA